MSNISPAKAHIERLCEEYKLEGHDKIADIIKNILEILSCELYDTSTHFIQELLQNADDNKYDCETPTLRFVYKPGSLRVDCNERGFDASNVEAICTIRQSTKAGRRGYTGEKGIGFKSVFRAADVVWISSGAYSFKFDKHRRFGLVAPLWAEFPEPIQEGYTSFFFQLSPQFDEKELVQMLLNFEATQILFLRRLRHVELEVTSPDGKLWTKSIHRTDTTEDGNAISYLEAGNIRLKYLMYKHQVTNLPEEAKRPGCTDSDLVLAFPFLDRDEEPHNDPQMVYAGLPIGNTDGLKFLLQGDFLLTASRLHIDTSLRWNRALRDGVKEALLRSIERLNESSMRYCWPFFINSNDKVSAFFKPAMTSAMKELKAKCLLESMAKTNIKPSNLFYVDPGKFVDDDGIPLTWHELVAGRYLSTNYPLWAIDSIKTLGATPLSEAAFLDHLSSKIGIEAEISAQSSRWHSALAKALLSLIMNPRHKQRLQKLQIIPLSSGGWTSASQKPAPMLMSKKFELAGLSIDHSIPIVDPEAATDQARMSLFRALGIMSIDGTRLCEWIYDQHRSNSFKPHDWTVSQLVGHFRILYESNWAPAGKDLDLWFATNDGGRCLGSKLYLGPKPGARTTRASDRVIDRLVEAFPCIHTDYFSIVSHSESNSGPRDPSQGDRHAAAVRLSRDSKEQWNDSRTRRLDLIERINPFQNNLSDFSAPSSFYGLDSGLGDLPTEQQPFTSNILHRLARKYEDRTSMLIPQRTRPIARTIPITPIPDHLTESLFSETAPQHRFTKYLTTTLQVSRIPRLVTIKSSNNEFKLSDDFRFLLRECPVADVLHLLLANWPSYSKWLEMSSDTENGDAAMNRARLVAEISHSLVKTSQGELRLCDTFAPRLDPFIEDAMLPVLDLNFTDGELGDEKDLKTILQRLALFEVITENTIHFYLASLTYLRRQSSPDTETVAYIYEQIQSRYDENEEIVERYFGKNNCIYVESKFTERGSNRRRWVDIKTCRRLKIDFAVQYPSSIRLFECLLATDGLTLAELVQKAAGITPTTPHQDILQNLTDISKVLPVISRKRASRTLKPLSSKTIFPIQKGKGVRPTLMSLESENWFIADRVHLRRAFLGTVNLLAYTPKELEAIEELIQVLSLTSRKLSNAVKSENRPSGKLKFDDSHTRNFATRSHFIGALIPKTHPRHKQLSREVQQVRVSTSAEVYLTHTLNLGSGQVIGEPERSLVACSASENIFQVFIAEECDSSRLPVPEIVEMLSCHFEIKDPAHLGLLYTLFTEKEYRKVQKAFAREGFDICDATKQLPSIKRYHSSLDSIPCPFNHDSNSNDHEDSEPYFGIRHRRSLKRCRRDGAPSWSSNGEDRRLPILYFVGDHMTPEGEEEEETAVGNPRYHCERMISQLFEKSLGRAYNPVKHWTSPFRELNAPAHHQNASPFTLSGSGLSDRVTDFLMENGIANIAEWHNWRPTFHFELAISAGGPTDSFEWTSTQLTRSLELRLPTDPYAEVHDVMVLVRVFNIYTRPEFQFFVNPWNLVTSGRIRFDQDCVVSATLQEAGPDPGALVFSSDSNTDPSGQWTAQVSSPSNYSHLRAIRDPQYVYQPGLSYYYPYMNAIPQLYSAPVYGPADYGSLIQPSLASNPIKTMSWEMKDRYLYRPLKKNEMRLLVLFPGQGADLPRGVLYSTPFNQAGSYAAISYVWGEQGVKYRVLTPDGILHIHDSLYRALVRVRKSTGITVLWADGICINQNDKSERSRQVMLMPRIFQNASVTVAILGYDREVGSAVEGLKNLRDAYIEDPESAELLPKGREPKWALIAKFFNNCWFRRAWIVQEAVASPEVVLFCGRFTINWRDLFAVMRTFDQHQHLPTDVATAWRPFRTLSWLRSWELQQTRWSVLLLLETFRDVKSSWTRDRFFSLLGISCDGNLPGFTPDYRSPLEVVVCSFARALVGQGMGMQVLYGAGISSQPHRFPSWIPDWTVPKPPSLSSSRNRGVIFSACGNTKARITCPEADSTAPAFKELEVEGYIVDTIKFVSKASNELKTWREYFIEVDTMVERLSPVFSKQIRQDLKREVPIAKAKHPQVAVPGGVDLHQSYKAFKKILEKQKHTDKYEKQRDSATASEPVSNAESQEMGLLTKSRSYELLLGGSIKGWRFATTESPDCGIVPNNAQVGDVVVVFGGGSVPFLVRKSSEREGMYQLIGECFISGVMDGKKVNSGCIQPEILRLH